MTITEGPLGITTSIGGEEDWVEPMIGGRIIYYTSDKLMFGVSGDVGGFGIGEASDLSWKYGRENEAESWLPVQEWALALRRRGVSVLFVHHAGKGGAQRGTSRREDVLDTVICLRHPDDYSPTEGARFEVHFEKARGLHGDDAKPFEAKLEVRDGAALWTMRDIEDAELARAIDLFSEGYSVRDTAAEMGISRSKAGRLRKAAVEQEMLDA